MDIFRSIDFERLARDWLREPRPKGSSLSVAEYEARGKEIRADAESLRLQALAGVIRRAADGEPAAIAWLEERRLIHLPDESG